MTEVEVLGWDAGMCWEPSRGEQYVIKVWAPVPSPWGLIVRVPWATALGPQLYSFHDPPV